MKSNNDITGTKSTTADTAVTKADIAAGPKLTKADIVESISESVGETKKNVQAIVDAFLGEMKQGLMRDQVIEFRGFGTFEVRTRKGRSHARNPKTGALVQVDDHGVVVFRPGKDLRDAAWDLRRTKKK